MFEYISPYYELKIGAWQIRKAVRIDVLSARVLPVDLAEIEFDTLGQRVRVAAGDPVEISLGYREKGLWLAFRGAVADVSVKRTTTVWAQDRMAVLRSSQVTQAFVDVSAHEVVQFVLSQAGITDVRLGKDLSPQRHYFVLSGQSIIDAIKLVNRTWGLHWDFYFEPEGTFVWEPWEESLRRQQAITTFELGKNIIDLTPKQEDHGLLETILLPFLRHSNLIQISDPRYWEQTVQARVEQVHHRFQDGKARTIIEWALCKTA